MQVCSEIALKITLYRPEYKAYWEDFVRQSANGTFLHSRNFMEYHADRFEDFSLIICQNAEILALLPGHQKGNEFHSHQGLTFGSWVMKKGLSQDQISAIIEKCLFFLKEKGIKRLYVKEVPDFYHEEKIDLTKIFQDFGGKLVNSNPNYVLKLPSTLDDRGKKWGVRQAMKKGVHIAESDDLAVFWEEILLPHHLEKLGRPPVHSLEEIEWLAQHNPGKISQVNAYKKGELLAGITSFEHPKVTRLQYIASTAEGRKVRAVDLLMAHLVYNSSKEYVDMGGVTDPNTGFVVDSLVQWKESFGAVKYLQNQWELKT